MLAAFESTQHLFFFAVSDSKPSESVGGFAGVPSVIRIKCCVVCGACVEEYIGRFLVGNHILKYKRIFKGYISHILNCVRAVVEIYTF